MKEIIKKAKQFKHTSLEHLDPEDLSNHKILMENDAALFLCSNPDSEVQINWATNSKESFFNGLDEAMEIISRNSEVKKVHIEFIPEDYVTDMENYGFVTVSEWIDLWNNNLAKVCIDTPEFIQIREIKDDEYQIASEITKSCKGYSRGYEGETSEWFKAWTECKDSSVFLAEMKNEIIGVCCVKLYGFDSDKGTILWLREVAVKPEHHSQKIGLKLMTHAINLGKQNGAVRSFLACDADNRKAIKLYEGLGYQRKTKRGQINMELTV